jgi:hypothetical protein
MSVTEGFWRLWRGNFIAQPTPLTVRSPFEALKLIELPRNRESPEAFSAPGRVDMFVSISEEDELSTYPQPLRLLEYVTSTGKGYWGVGSSPCPV